jgi:hypothetical protein
MSGLLIVPARGASFPKPLECASASRRNYLCCASLDIEAPDTTRALVQQ